MPGQIPTPTAPWGYWTRHPGPAHWRETPVPARSPAKMAVCASSAAFDPPGSFQLSSALCRLLLAVERQQAHDTLAELPTDGRARIRIVIKGQEVSGLV